MMDLNKLLQYALSFRKDAVKLFKQALSRRKPVLGGLAVIVLIFILLAMSGARGPSAKESTVTPAKRGDFTVSVTEEGNLKSLDTIDIRCEVEGRNITIISLIEEGTYITEDDVADSRILVQLDSSSFEEQLNRQKISLMSAGASYTQAREELEIQRKQSESDVNAAEMKLKFEHMDLEKYLGAGLAEKAISDTVSYQELLNSEDLGGEAKQSQLKFESDIDLAQSDLTRAESKLNSTKKMEKKGWVSTSDLELAKLDHKRSRNSVQQQEIAQDLFLRYGFPKKIEQLISNYLEAINELDRTRTRVKSRLVKAEIDVESKEAKYSLEKEQVEKLTTQVEKCTIRATSPGLVTYSSIRRWEEPLKEGSTVRKSQKLLTIPNLTKMGADVSVQEASIDKIKEGQVAVIQLEAFPDRPLTGLVTKIAIMPDAQNRWMSPDVKVYKVEVEISGEYDFLKPGMTCDVEIIVEKIKDVILVPIQAVMLHEGRKVCVVASSPPEIREVEPGAYNEKFVEIRRGLKEGEKVLLYKPVPFPTRTVPLPEP